MKKLVLVMATLFSLGVVVALPIISSWKVSPEYNIQFSSKDVSGIFKTFSGSIAFDPANLPGSSFSLVVDVASINTGNGLQNKHAKSDEWFDAAKYPQIKFTSSRIDKSATGYLVKGIMEIHGVKKETSIPFTFTQSGNKGTFASSFVIKRTDYNVGKPGGDVANDIKIDVKVPVAK